MRKLLRSRWLQHGARCVAVAGALLLSGCGGDDPSNSTAPTAVPIEIPEETVEPAPTVIPSVSVTPTPEAAPVETDAHADEPRESADAIETTEAAGDELGISDLTDAEVAEIRAAFVAFFDGTGTTLDDRVAFLEDGEQYRTMLEEASVNVQFMAMTADVREVRNASAQQCSDLGVQEPCAIVIHDLLVGDFPMAVSVENVAVQIDGRWLVASSAWCAVVELGGASCT